MKLPPFHSTKGFNRTVVPTDNGTEMDVESDENYNIKQEIPLNSSSGSRDERDGEDLMFRAQSLLMNMKTSATDFI